MYSADSDVCRTLVLLLAERMNFLQTKPKWILKDGNQSRFVKNLLKEKEFLDLNQRRVCIGGLTNSKTAKENGLEDPYISEAGRRFLATLLMELSNEQIRDLFIVARADKMGEFIEEDGIKGQ